MPRGLSSRARHAGGGLVRDVALVLVLFGVGGLAAGVLWRWTWRPLDGTVLDGTWFPDANSSPFGATGLYVLIALSLGVLLGALSALLTDRRELATLGLVAVGSLLAGWVMLQVGEIGMPADPGRLARTAPDRTRLPGTLTVTGWTPLIAFPAGALAGLAMVFVGLSRRVPDRGPDVGADG